MHIVHVTSELSPFVKAGGLADMLQGLSNALKASHHQVTVILPKYGLIDPLLIPDKTEKISFSCYFQKSWQENLAHIFSFTGGRLVLLEPVNLPFFSGKEIYTSHDISRFLYFSRSVLEFLQAAKYPIDILHVHDWHAAICPFLLHTLFFNHSIKISRCLLTIHNLLYQGIAKKHHLEEIGFSEKDLQHVELKNPGNPSQYNLLRAGIEFADWVTTVSPNYSQEILTVEKGSGLQEVLRKHQNKLSGILNGIDYEAWNPQKDPHVKVHFSKEDSIENILEKKKENKLFLQKKLHLKEKDVPLLIIVCRLVEQKGLELILHGIKQTLELEGQVVLLGSSPCSTDQKTFEKLEKKLLQEEAHFHFAYNEKLSRMAYAAADFILIPSRFEPCGLTQLIGMRYGVIPIVRKTGGLADTVFDIDDKTLPEEKKNGYSFAKYEEQELESTLKRAFHMWHKDKKKHRLLLKNTLTYDFSWNKPCKEYLSLYSQLLSEDFWEKPR